MDKEVEILNHQQKGKLNFQLSDRVIFSSINIIDDIKDSISIIKPETVLKWQWDLLKKFWTINIKTKKTGNKEPDPSS